MRMDSGLETFFPAWSSQTLLEKHEKMWKDLFHEKDVRDLFSACVFRK